MPENDYDIIIIGGGPAGLTAGLYCSRARLKTLLIEKMGCGGQSVITDWIENYPGFPGGISGFELAGKIEEQARKFGLEIKLEDALGIGGMDLHGSKTVKTSEKEYNARALILATGANHKTLNVPGEFELRGKGVSYCATCDGPFFRDKDVFVVGGGNSAVQEAIFLTRFARSVGVIHRRDRLRAVKILQERAKANPKIRFLLNSVIESINGKEKVEGITLKNALDNKKESIPADGVFIFAGLVPNTEFLDKTVELDEPGYIITDENMKTSVPGIFACGDVRKKLLRQVVTATGEGAAAAFTAQEYVEELRGTSYK